VRQYEAVTPITTEAWNLGLLTIRSGGKNNTMAAAADDAECMDGIYKYVCTYPGSLTCVDNFVQGGLQGKAVR
jgi:hypothetical protein